MRVIGYKDADGNAVSEADAVAQGAPSLGEEFKLRPTCSDCPAHDTRCTKEACAWATGQANGPRGLSGRDTWPSLGDLPVHECIDPSIPPGYVRVDGKLTRQWPVQNETDLEWLLESKRRLAAAGVKPQEPIPFVLTPKAEAELDALLLEGDAIQQQLRPPPVPEVTSPAFKLGVFCGLLVGSGVASALPYIVELLK